MRTLGPNSPLPPQQLALMQNAEKHSQWRLLELDGAMKRLKKIFVDNFMLPTTIILGIPSSLTSVCVHLVGSNSSKISYLLHVGHLLASSESRNPPVVDVDDTWPAHFPLAPPGPTTSSKPGKRHILISFTSLGWESLHR